MRPRREPVEKGRVRALARPRPLAERPEQPFLVVAEDGVRRALLEERDDLVRKPVFPDAVAEADQLVDIAHQVDGAAQPGGVGMNGRDDAELHARVSFDAAADSEAWAALVKAEFAILWPA